MVIQDWQTTSMPEFIRYHTPYLEVFQSITFTNTHL